MKIKTLLALMLAVFVGVGAAQTNNTFSVYTGYTMSAFEDQEEAAGTLPLGIQFGFNVAPNVEVGLEAFNAIGGYKYEADFFGVETETAFNSTIISGYGKYYVSQANLSPFIKAGVGYFLGDAKIKMSYMGEEEEDDMKIDPAIGFILGAGVDFNKNFFAEFNYNIVSRKSGEEDTDEGDFELMKAAAEEDSDDSWGMNSWTIKVGYRFQL